MINQKTFLEFPTDSKGRSYFVENGVVKLNNVPTPLPDNAIGWQDRTLSFGRNTTYFGINRSYAEPLKFVNDGATILRHLFYTKKGVEEALWLNINKWNDTTGNHDHYMKAEVDTTQYEDAADGVSVNLLEGGLAKYIKANESTVYEFPCNKNVPEAVQVYMDGMNLSDTLNYSFINIDLLDRLAVVPTVFLNNDGDSYGISHGDQNYEKVPNDPNFSATSANWVFSSVNPVNIRIKGTARFAFQDGANPGNGQLLLGLYYATSKNTHAQPLIVEGSYQAGADLPFDVTIPLQADENLQLIYLTTDITSIAKMQETAFTISFVTKSPPTTVYALRPLDLFAKIISKVTDGKYSVDSDLLTEFKNLLLTSGDALRGFDDAVIKTCLKDFFSAFNTPKNIGLGIVNGKARMERKAYFFNAGLTTMDVGEVSDFKVTVASDHFFNTLKIGYPDKTFEERAGREAFNTGQQYSLPITKYNKSLELVSPYIADPFFIEFNRANYNGQTTTDGRTDNDVFYLDTVEDVVTPTFNANISASKTFNAQETDVPFDTVTAGLESDASNQKLTYRGATQTVKINSLITSTAAGLVQVNLRINGIPVYSLNGQGNGNAIAFTSYQTINSGDVITLHVFSINSTTFTIDAANLYVEFAASSRQILYREKYDTITGLTNPDSAFNVRLSPKRCVLEHGNYLRSFMHNLPAEFIKFLTSDKNKDLATVKQGVTVIEKADVSVGTLAAPLFLPYVFSFKTKVPYNFTDLMEASSLGCIEFSVNGFQLKGFVMECSVKPAFNDVQEWKLLCAPDVDLAKLMQHISPDGLNLIDAMSNNLFISELNPVKFYPFGTDPYSDNKNHFIHMDDDLLKLQFKSVNLDGAKYFQKWQKDDIISLQFISRLDPIQLQIMDTYGRPVGAVIAVPSIHEPVIIAPSALYQVDISLAALPAGVYYLKLSAGTGTVETLISEPFEVAASWPNTMLIQYSNTRNKQATVFANTTAPFAPSFRVEGTIWDFKPDGKFTSYEDEPLDMETIEGVATRKFQLIIGDGSGVPDWVADKINRISMLNRVEIDGKGYSRDAGSKLESKRENGVVKAYWTVDIREAKNHFGITVDGGVVTGSNIIVAYNVDTKAFGDTASNISNIVKIEEVD